MQPSENKNILVLGAGFGGIYAAVNLSKRLGNRKDIKISVVDGNRYHLFKPMLHEVATGSVEPTHIIQPIRTIKKGRDFDFVDGLIQKIDLGEKTVRVCSDCLYCEKVNDMNLGEFDISRACFKPLKRKVLKYDYLVIAVGGVPNFYNISGVKEHAFPLYSLEDAVKIREHVSNAFEIADHMEDPEIRRRILTFVVAGAGPTGIELITELHDWIYQTLSETFENVMYSDIALILVEAGKDILPFSAENVRVKARDTMKDMKISILTDSPVVKVEKNYIETGGRNPQRIYTNSLFWTAGVKSNDILDNLDVEKDRIGRIKVNEFLQVNGLEGVYAIGDCASFQLEGMAQPLPQTGQVAVQEAACLVDNLVSEIYGRERKAFGYREMGSMVSLGERSAAANVFSIIGLSGFFGWLMWKLVYFKHLMGIHRKLRVVLDWFFDITYDREASRHKFG